MKRGLIIGLLALAACEAPPPAQPSLPAAGEDTCGAAQHEALIGQDATALERVLIMGPVRVIRPMDAVTMDFRQDRINFRIDGQNRIASIGCF